ncbi:MAG: Gldg family protein [Bacteroidales bacterium]|nr:Gldg family protein [Bacteroidales bacterium]
MRMIYKIARTELQILFYSPVAWLILIVFTIQASMEFTEVLEVYVEFQSLNYPIRDLSMIIFGNTDWGAFVDIQKHLYLYIPLLTMGLISRELGSGSIKLLYSSPVTNTQIILGKYLSMVIYALVLSSVLLLLMVYSSFTIDNFDFPGVSSGLLGLFLLICTYAAIGLFMSSLTSYQVVAALGTFAILAVLNTVNTWWQDIPMVRDITYWFSIRGRTLEFIRGLICSEDLLYFLIVISLFISLSILRINSIRQKTPFKISLNRYLGAVIIAFAFGYITSRPAMMLYYDATRTKANTLTANSQEIVSKVKGGLTINTYINILDKYYYLALPSYQLQDMDRFRQYVRFKPETKIKYHYYYDKAENPDLDKRYPNLSDRERMVEYAKSYRLDSSMFMRPEEIKLIEDLEPEKNRFVRTLVRDNGEKTFLRVFDDKQKYPSEAEISAAFKRLVMELPKVGFVKGHGERNCVRTGDRDYFRFAQDKPFRYSLINQGFDFREVTLGSEIPPELDILVIADLRTRIKDDQMVNLKKYIDSGGNLLIAAEPVRQEHREQYADSLLSLLGVKVMPGRVVKPGDNYLADFIVATPTKEGGKLMYPLENMRERDQVITMPGAVALSGEKSREMGFNVTELFVTDTTGGAWIEVETTNFIDDTVKINPEVGEKSKAAIPVVLALSRMVGEKEQKIIISGDADCISNGEISISRNDIPAANYSMITGLFFWMSDNEVPIDVRRPATTDRKLFLEISSMEISKWVLQAVLPIILALFYIVLWIKRRGR